ncbi:MAG TPA: LytTR family DNA-binding domain-containing protein [Lacibacter sp.]|nr:LytTR family DNA-binding domain-containing protein [Lacibacter sp.]HMO87851.1 LytTR family DNA-binding domain-containing protein [Lacibacter sp.]
MQTHFFTRLNGKYVRINLSEILYIEGCRNYVKIVTAAKPILALITLKSMEAMLPEGMFVRIHKSYIVSLDRIQSFDADEVQLPDRILPVGSQYKGVLERKVFIVQEKKNVIPDELITSEEGILHRAAS